MNHAKDQLAVAVMSKTDGCDIVESPGSWTKRWAPALVFGLGLLLLIPGTRSESSITDADEYARTLRTPMEIIERHDWLTPWLDGEPRLRKPPALYWVIAATYKVFGIHLLCGRIWGVLMGAGLAACATLLARELFRRDGWLAGLLTLATVSVAIEGRQAMLDLPVATLSAYGVYCFVRWAREFAAGWLLAGGAMLAAAMLVKGPVALIFFGGAVLAWVVVCNGRQQIGRNWPHVMAAVAVLLLLAAPWPVAMYLRWGAQSTSALATEIAARHFGDFSEASPFVALGGSVGLVLPWSLMVPFAIWESCRSKEVPYRQQRLWLIVWCLIALIPFLFIRTFERYMLGLVPAQMVLVAEWLEQQSGPDRQLLLRISVGMAAVVVMVAGGLVWWFVPGWKTLVLALGMTALGVVSCCCSRPRVAAFGIALLLATFWGGSYPQLGIGRLPAELPAELSRYPARVYHFEPEMLSIRLGHSVQKFHPDAWQKGKLAAQDRFIVFVQEDELAHFRRTLANNGLQSRRLQRFRMSCTTRSWRLDASGAQWREAFANRSLEDLKPNFDVYLVGPSSVPF